MGQRTGLRVLPWRATAAVSRGPAMAGRVRSRSSTIRGAMTEPTITADRDALPPQRPPHADLSTPYRTHTCGELRATDAGLSVKVAGWVHRRRDHGHLIFLDLRDRHGIVQVVLDQHEASAAHEIASRVRNEFVVAIAGVVAERLPG